MSATIAAGPASLYLNIATPLEADGTTPRDDITSVKVWYSTSSATFVPPGAGTLAYSGTGLSITLSALNPGTTYYVRYALVSEIDPDNYVISAVYTATPQSAPQVIDISGYASFTQAASGVFTPTATTLTASQINITSPAYSWAITGATPASATGASVTVTPTANSTGITATVTVSGTNTAAALVKAVYMPVVYNGAAGQAGANGTMTAFPSIYIWTTDSTAPTRPTTTSNYTWSTGAYTAPAGWSTTPPADTTPGKYLWQLTIPAVATSTAPTGSTANALPVTTTLDWTLTANPIRAISYNGANGSGTFVIDRGASATSTSPTVAEVTAAVGRAAVAGDIATVRYNNGSNATIWKYTTSWVTTTTYLTGDLIVDGTITGSKIAVNSVTADRIDSKGLSIKAADGTVILSAGSTIETTTLSLPSSITSTWLNSNVETLSLVSSGVVVTGNTVIKDSAGTVGWNAQVYSKDGYANGSYVSFTANSIGRLMVGLNSDPATSAHNNTIDYAIFLSTASSASIATPTSVLIYEGGTDTGVLLATPYVLGDVFTITHDGANVRYYQNGTLLKTTVAVTASPLYLDSSFYHLSAGISKLQFGPLSSNVWADVAGTGKPSDNANNTFVDSTGAIQGVSQNSGTIVDNSVIRINRNLVRGLHKWTINSNYMSPGQPVPADGRVLGMTAANNFQASNSPDMTLGAGTYTLSFIATNISSSARALSADLFPDTYPQTNFTIPAQSTWTLYKTTWVVTAAMIAASATSQLRFFAAAVASGDMYIANIKLEYGNYTPWCANDADSDNENNLSANAASALSATVSVNAVTGAGFRAGDLTWDSSGTRTGGKGVAMTPGGLVGHNGTDTTFVIDATTGAASFKGDLTGASGTFSGDLNVKSAISGSRIEILSDRINVYEGTILRVRIGNLA